MITNSIIKNSQNLTLMTRILIDLSFFMMILIIRIIITISSNNSSSYTLFKNNNVRYLKFVDLYKLLTKTQTSLLSKIKINFVNKTQTLTIMITEIRLSLTILSFNDDLLLKHINIILKVKKTSYQKINKSNIMFIKTSFTRMSFNKKRNFIIIIISTIIIVSTKKLKIRIS